ncbi:MAG TPA: DnaD domain protein [Ktedonobacteraceae bacterium]|nr:DnaD domain protein [Ktedonobacteraceae bacterium]
MTAFTGFPGGKNPYVPVPEVFFTVLLPEIEDTAELKVTLHLFWLLAQKQGNPRCVSDRELLADRVLLRGLRRQGDPRPAEERLRLGLEQAVTRGTLLRIHLKLLSELSGEEEVIGWYFFNTTRSRKVVHELQGAEMVPVSLLERDEQVTQASAISAGTGQRLSSGYAGSGELARARVQVEQPNIFVLYEQNIGLLTPMIASQLEDAADHYPADWIEAAFSEAVQRNKRNWKYISAILRRWETEGRQAWNA